MSTESERGVPVGSRRGGLEGVVPPLITPLADRDRLDLEGLERLIEHVLRGGVHGVFILGTTGEAPSLGYRLRGELIDRTCAQVRGRVPVLVGITDTSMVESLGVARRAAEAGAAAVVASAPYYFRAGQPELVDFVGQLVSELPLPLFIYNMPAMTKVQFEPATLERLTGLAGVVGVKDSSGDLGYFRRVLEVARARLDWRVFMGPEELLVEALEAGGHGGVNGGAQIEPELLVGLFEAVRCGDRARVEVLQGRLLKLGEIYRIGRHASAVIKGVKCALSLLGICDDRMADPFARFAPPERERVRAVLRDLGLRV
jgi:2-dehydro-3-deoxy-D-pentonate aldolase